MVARPFPRVVFRHQLVGRVHSQTPEEHGGQPSLLSKAIKLRGDCSNRCATDLIAAPFVAEDVPHPPTRACLPLESIPRATEPVPAMTITPGSPAVAPTKAFTESRTTLKCCALTIL